jgi:small subunit ribosomal protein S16
MLRIRLSRVGRKHDPSFRLVVIEKGRAPQSGAYIEELGSYDATENTFDPVVDRIEHWLKEGAQPTDTVHNLLVQEGIVDAETRNPLPKKTPIESGADAEADEGDGEIESARDSNESDADGSEADENETDEEETDNQPEDTEGFETEEGENKNEGENESDSTEEKSA